MTGETNVQRQSGAIEVFDIDLDLALTDFGDAFEKDADAALRDLMALLLDEVACEIRIEFLQAVAQHAGPDAEPPREGQAENFGRELRLLAYGDLFAEAAEGKLNFSRLAALTCDPNALWDAHRVAVAQDPADVFDILFAGLLPALQQRSERLRTVTVVSSGWNGMPPESYHQEIQLEGDTEAWDWRIPLFGRNAAPRVWGLLSQANVLGVGYGESVWSLVDAITHYGGAPGAKPGLTCVATSGTPTAAIDRSATPNRKREMHCSCKLAQRLSFFANGSHLREHEICFHTPTLLTLPQPDLPLNDPKNHEQLKYDRLALPTRHPDWDDVFNPETGRIHNLDSLVTSFGNASQTNKHLTADSNLCGIPQTEIDELTLCDIGGAHLPKPDLNEEQQERCRQLTLRWTGIQLEHIAACADKEPGVTAVALASNKADALVELISYKIGGRRGLTTHLIIDDDLGLAVANKLGC